MILISTSNLYSQTTTELHKIELQVNTINTGGSTVVFHLDKYYSNAVVWDEEGNITTDSRITNPDDVTIVGDYSERSEGWDGDCTEFQDHHLPMMGRVNYYKLWVETVDSPSILIECYGTSFNYEGVDFRVIYDYANGVFKNSSGSTIVNPVNLYDDPSGLQPTPPKNFRCTNSTSWGNNPEFAWERPDQPTSTTLTYNIYWNAGGGYQKINGSPITGTTYTHTGVELEKFGTTNFYYVTAKGSSSPESKASNIAQIKTDHAAKKQPEKTAKQDEINKKNITELTIFPNPFNPSTQVSYSLPKENYVRLNIYNISGQKIIELVNQFQYSGEYIVNFDGHSMAGGIYFVRLQVGDQIKPKKVLLFK
jgi:hypothetical protein